MTRPIDDAGGPRLALDLGDEPGDDIVTRADAILARAAADPLAQIEEMPIAADDRRPLRFSKRPILADVLYSANWQRDAIAVADDVRDALERVKQAADGARLDAVDRAALTARLLDDLRTWQIRDCRPLVRAVLGDGASRDTRASDETTAPALVTDDEPHADPVDGAALLTETAALLRRHVVMTAEQADAAALWIAAAHLIDALSVMPILLITAPTMRAGKTTLLMVLAALTPRALAASNITGAVLVRLIARHRPTLLLDEADTWLLRDDAELRGIVNAGEYRATAYVFRCAPETHEPEAIPCFAARALSMIGSTAATIADRSIVLALRRKRPDETIARLRLDTLRATHDERRRRFRRWANDHRAAVRELSATLPEEAIPAGVTSDRARGHWRPLLAIAGLAGGGWPARAQAAAVALSGGEAADTEAVVELLRDIAGILEDDERDIIPSAALLAALVGQTDRPWAEWRQGRPLTPRGLARLLGSIDVHPDRHTATAGRTRGYRRDALTHTLARYLPSYVSMRPSTNEDGAAGHLRMCPDDPGRDTYDQAKTPIDTGSGTHGHIDRGDLRGESVCEAGDSSNDSEEGELP